MSGTATLTVANHRMVLSPDGTIQVDDVVFLPPAWSKIVEVGNSHLVRRGLKAGHRCQPRSFLKPAPLWVRLFTFGRVHSIPSAGLAPFPSRIKRY